MTKHIEIDCHFILEKIAFKDIKIEFDNLNYQLTGIFTKSLQVKISYICNKFNTFDLYDRA